MLHHCRLSRGKNIGELFAAVNKRFNKLQPGAEQNAFKAWAWLLSMKILHGLAQVGV